VFCGLVDQLGVNEWHRGRFRSLVQVIGLYQSYQVGAGLQGCCTYLLYRVALRGAHAGAELKLRPLSASWAYMTGK